MTTTQDSGDTVTLQIKFTAEAEVTPAKAQSEPADEE